MTEVWNSRFPFSPFPVGWFQVGYSHELAVGEARPVQAFGKHMVLYRGESGKPYLLDAFCPHLGAHLGHGGTVEGESIRCPFHAWRYDCTGACDEVPYATRMPSNAKINPWLIQERNGLIMVHHDPSGAAPRFDLPDLPEYQNPEWTEYRTRVYRIRTHNMEMAENSVDAPHFKYLHKTMTATCTDARIDGHVFRTHCDVQVDLSRWGMGEDTMDGSIDVETHGFGFSVVRLHLAAEVITIATVTPVDGEWVDARFAFAVKKFEDPAMTDFIGNQVVDDIQKQVEEDQRIWENKIFIDKPILCDNDGPIGLYRKWARQFLPVYRADAGSTQAA
ncbi:MAG: Rieske 2Fe-2S domain-containing protein [bacterium]